jgi:hypothetical protein
VALIAAGCAGRNAANETPPPLAFRLGRCSVAAKRLVAVHAAVEQLKSNVWQLASIRLKPPKPFRASHLPKLFEQR